MLRKHDDNLLPYHTSLQVVHIMNFIENDVFNISNKISSTIEHTSENLCSHDETAGLGSDLYISSKDTNVVKGLPKVAELLIAQRLDGRSIDGLSHVFGGK